MTDKQRFKAARRIPRPGTPGEGAALKKAQHPAETLSGRGSGLLLALLPIFLVPATLIKFFTFRLDQALVLGLSIVALGAAAALVRQGQTFHARYDAAVMARGAPWPRKGLGFALIAVAVGASLAGASPVSWGLAALLGALAGAAAYFSYGLDPLRDKQPEGASTPERDPDSKAANQRVWQHIEVAETKIAGLKATAEALDRQTAGFARHETKPPLAPQVTAIAAKILRVAELAQRVVDLVRQDPSDLNQARRFFVTYLDQVSQVSDKFRLYADQARDLGQYQRLADLSGAYQRVLDTIEAACHEQIERLQAHDLMDLEVQIEVLQTQLDREGLV
jgi:hypothetical protein